MAELHFEWDWRKAQANEAKHGVAFAEAVTAFDDEHAFSSRIRTSHDEERFVLMGLSARERILVAVHCYRESNAVMRLISARRATANERQEYLSRSR